MEMIKADHQLIWKSQRQPEPASFWMALLLGSISLHGLGLLVLRPLLKAVQPPLSESVAIDFVELSEPSTTSPSQAASQASPLAVSPQAISPEAESPPAAPSPPLSDTTVIPSAALTPTVIPSPSLPPLAQPTPPVRQSPVSSPTPRSSSPTQPAKAPQTSAANLPPVPAVPSTSSDLATGNVTANQTGKTASTMPPTGAGPDSNLSLPTIVVTEQRTQSSGLKLTVLAVAPVEDGMPLSPTDTLAENLSDNRTPAHPKEQSQNFPEAIYPASVALNLGQPIQLRVEVNAQGQANPIEVRQGSAAHDLDDLAQDLIRQVLFDPATEAGKPITSRVDISLRLDPLER